MIPLRSAARLGLYGADVEAGLSRLSDGTPARLWAKDHTVWSPLPTEIANRLGWLDSPWAMTPALADIDAVTQDIRSDSFTQAVLMGMGGSSLAPEVFRKVFGVAEDFLDLAVLDSTDPDAVLALAERLDFAKTLFIVSTKSGGTVETFSFLKYFYNRAADILGNDEAGRHFLAITDPGSGLADEAQRLGFRHIFYNDPDIGGRYSALSFFGLAPASLIGMDIHRFLARARETADKEREAAGRGLTDSDGFWLGTVMGVLARMGRDKLTFLFSPDIAPFGDWLEQLIAESTGKEGTGIVPVVGELLDAIDAYGNDRLFVCLRTAADGGTDALLASLAAAGHPVVVVALRDIYDLGAQMFLWEIATAIAGAHMGINPFDQPNVESAKVLARKMMAACKETGRLPEESPLLSSDAIDLYGNVVGETVEAAIGHFLALGWTGDYVAIQAYVAPAPAMDEALQGLRRVLAARTGLATTVGYGPRFLHSTGQLHKGDAGRGLFLQITANPSRDAAIPDRAGQPESALTFATLKAAQALGDRQALIQEGRRVLRFHCKQDPIAALKALSI